MQDKLNKIPHYIVSVKDYQAVLHHFIEAEKLAFIEAGAEDELTCLANISAFQEINLAGRVLGDVVGGNTNVEFLSNILPHPIMLAPIGYQKIFHKYGELETAQAAKVTNTPFVISALANTYIDDIAKYNDGMNIFQLYFRASQKLNLEIIERAQNAGCKAIMITVDAPMSGIRNVEQRAGFSFPSHLQPVNTLGKNPDIELNEDDSIVFDGFMKNAPNWNDIEWIIKNTSLPVILKGILHPDDAKRAIDIGAYAIVVSNHGGRVLGSLPPTIKALPRIKKAVGNDIKILFDGGIRRGSDIFKAVALGADMVMIGRPYIYGLCVAGALGVAHIIRTLHEELSVTMAISGAKEIKQINTDYLF